MTTYFFRLILTSLVLSAPAAEAAAGVDCPKITTAALGTFQPWQFQSFRQEIKSAPWGIAAKSENRWLMERVQAYLEDETTRILGAKDLDLYPGVHAAELTHAFRAPQPYQQAARDWFSEVLKDFEGDDVSSPDGQEAVIAAYQGGVETRIRAQQVCVLESISDWLISIHPSWMPASAVQGAFPLVALAFAADQRHQAFEHPNRTFNLPYDLALEAKGSEKSFEHAIAADLHQAVYVRISERDGTLFWNREPLRQVNSDTWERVEAVSEAHAGSSEVFKRVLRLSASQGIEISLDSAQSSHTGATAFRRYHAAMDVRSMNRFRARYLAKPDALGLPKVFVDSLTMDSLGTQVINGDEVESFFEWHSPAINSAYRP